MAIHSVVLEQAFGNNSEGDVIQCDEEVAGKLVEAGIAREATAEDLDGGAEDDNEDQGGDESPELVQDQVAQLARSVETAVTKATAKAAEKLAGNHAVKRPGFAGVHAGGSDEFETGGFKNIGEFCQTVMAKDRGNYDAIRKLTKFKAVQTKGLATKGQMSVSGSSGHAGGDMVPTEWAKEMWRLAFTGVPDLLGMCSQYPMEHQTLKIPVWVQSSAASGVQASVVSEATAITDTTGVTATQTLTLQKFAALVNTTDELERFNAYALDAVLKSIVPQRIRYLQNSSIINGTNSQVNLVGAASTVTVTRAANSVFSYADIVNMDAALFDDFADDAVWLVNPSSTPKLYSIRFPDNSGAYPAFTPGAFGVENLLGPKPLGTLLGRPIYKSESVPGIAAKGCLILYSPKSIAAGQTGLIGDSTPFLYFDKAVNTYRFLWYADTESLMTAPYTRADSSTASNIVVLAADV